MNVCVWIKTKATKFIELKLLKKREQEITNKNHHSFSKYTHNDKVRRKMATPTSKNKRLKNKNQYS